MRSLEIDPKRRRRRERHALDARFGRAELSVEVLEGDLDFERDVDVAKSARDAEHAAHVKLIGVERDRTAGLLGGGGGGGGPP